MLTHLVSIETLSPLLAMPPQPPEWCPPPLGAGSLRVWELPSGQFHRTRQVLLSCLGQFVLLVDEFHQPDTQWISLLVESTSPIEGGRRRYLTRSASVPDHPVAVHPLGDYAVDRVSDTCLAFHQKSARGRFLLAITRDPQAQVRVLNGWAVELRTQDQVVHLLHSNLSGKLRPLGPIHVDARYAAVWWPRDPEPVLPPHEKIQLVALGARHLRWSQDRELVATAPTDWTLGPVPGPPTSATTPG